MIWKVFVFAAEDLCYVWHRFADEILRKQNKEGYGETCFISENSLKLLHPFMPFIEEIWQSMNKRIYS